MAAKPTTNQKLALQAAEFAAAEDLRKAIRAINWTPVVDDECPEVRHNYESALAALIEAMQKNGRFDDVGNRYKLRPV